MKAIKYPRIVLAVLFVCLGITAFAQPGWEVNPNQFVYSMTVTGKVYIDGIASEDENDMIAAFIDGECRGVAQVKYQSVLDDYFFFLMIYSNDADGEITFKIYDASKDTVIVQTETHPFGVNSIVGSVSEPEVQSGNATEYGVELMDFKFDKQSRPTEYTQNVIKVNLGIGAVLSGIAPTFSLSDSARVYVKNIEQESGVTSNDFSSLVMYRVESPNPLIFKNYFVQVTSTPNTPSNMRVSSLEIEENSMGFIGELSLTTLVPGSHGYVFADADSTENEFFVLRGDSLFAGAAFDFEQQSSYAIRIKADDQNGGVFEKDFTVSVVDQNESPTSIHMSDSVVSSTARENAVVALLSTTDPDLSDQHQYRLSTGDGNNDLDNGLFTISGDSLVLTQGLSGIKTRLFVFIQVSDNEGLTSDKAFELNVMDLNNAPDITSMPLDSVLQGQVFSYTLLVSDHEGDPIEIRTEGLPDWLSYDTLTTTFTGTATNALVGDHSFSVVASDGFKESMQQVSVRVIDVNDPPTGVELSVGEINNASLVNTLVGNLAALDIDKNDVHQFSLAVGNGANDRDNDFFKIIDNTLVVKQTLNFAKGAMCYLLIDVMDQSGAMYQQALEVSVKGVNRVPEFMSTPSVSVLQDSVFTYLLNADDADGDSLIFRIEGLPQWLTFSAETNTFSGSPSNDWVGDYTFFIIASDGEAEVIQKVELLVIDTNDEPVGLELSNREVGHQSEANTFVGILSAVDPDVMDTHQYSLVEGDGENDKGNAWFTIVGDSLFVQEALNWNDGEEYPVLIKVSDKAGLVFTKSVNLMAMDINEAPEILSTPLNYVFQDQVYVYALEVKDKENDPLTISFETLPEWLSYNENTGLLSGTPHNENVGDHSFSILVNDGSKQSTQQVVLSVLDVNDPPEIQFYPGMQNFISGSANSVQLPADLITDPDPADELTFSLALENNSALPEWLNFDPVTLTLSGTPDEGESGIYKLKLSAIDKGRLKEWLVFELQVSSATSIDRDEREMSFAVYPNPVQNEMYLDIPDGEEALIRLHSLSGQVVKTWRQSEIAGKSVSIQEILPGVYFVHCRQGDANYVQRIIKQ